MKTSKSLVLAPAVAVAVSGLIAVPAFASAASTPSESSDSIELPTDLPKAGPATVQPPQSPDGSAGATESSDASESASASESATEAPEAGTPEAILETDQVSQADIADKNKGIRFSGTGFTPEGEATVTVVGTEGTPYKPKSKLTVTEDGEVNGRYFFTASEGAKVPTGTYTLFLTDLKSEQESEKVEFEVVEKVDESATPAPTETATESASPTPTETATESALPRPRSRPRRPVSPRRLRPRSPRRRMSPGSRCRRRRRRPRRPPRRPRLRLQRQRRPPRRPRPRPRLRRTIPPPRPSILSSRSTRPN